MYLEKAAWIYKEIVGGTAISKQLTPIEKDQAIIALGGELFSVIWDFYCEGSYGEDPHKIFNTDVTYPLGASGSL